MDRRLITLTAVLALGLALPAVASAQCARTITADVVALDQVFFWNRLGAVQPQGMVYALRRDVVPLSGGSLTPGNVVLRDGKRPRPLVLRMGVGDCLEIHFQNLLANSPMDEEQPATRKASIHVVGLELLSTILDDGSNVGSVTPPGSLVAPGQTAVYRLRAEREGEHVMHSAGAMTGGEGEGGSTPPGLFGAVIVEPAGSVWYRSQVSRAEMDHAQAKTIGGLPKFTASGHPVIDYDRVYPLGHPLQGQPVLRMLDANNELIYGDLRAIVTGSDPDVAPYGRFANGTYPPNPVLPDRLQPFREFVTIYHDEIGAVQAFPIFTDPIFAHPTHSVRDAFAINYGTGGIGAEILANRFKVGPMWDCPECKYEEFFLSSWTVGDPAMVVDFPANAPCMIPTSNPNRIRQQPGFSEAIDDLKDWAIDGEEPCAADQGPKATKAFFPDDPSNVYPSYISDHVKFRILHAGPKEHHIHHQHAHQWVFSPDSDKSTYLDSQAIGPGASFTLEMTHDGSGNRNQTVGDSIFHCHFYPHFAMGMWAMWRVHDVFEWGTPLDSRGKPQERSRAYPDGEIAAGTPIPGVVPLPGLPMAPLPERLVGIFDGQVTFLTNGGNPGFPFFVPAIAGHRPPHPPLDFATTVDGVTPVPPIDGGLPRHVIRDGAATSVETRLDFSKVLDLADAVELPEDGTEVEVAAMEFHEKRLHPTCTPSNVCDTSYGGGGAVNFVANGLERQQGAPFADPCINDAGQSVGNRRFYSAANIQLDVTFNKVGWHFPQQRILTLVGDVDDTLAGLRPPEPLFFRGNTNDCIEYLHTNLVPHEYELDDYQVRTPTDILGQHIHLVKFDVTSSDGAGNGWNYEDGTFSPGEVRERMRAIRAFNHCLGDEITGRDLRDGTFACPIAEAHPLWPDGGPDENGDGVPDWLGAQTTVQRWYADDVLNLSGQDRTLRTVFTHDHYGPSTHQQVGLYAGLVIEPLGSTWHNQDDGTQFYTRFDGGPTSWRADVRTTPSANSFREFLLEFADFQHAYEEDNVGFPDPDNAINPPAKEEAGLPFLVQRSDRCPVLHGEELGIEGPEAPCPELISAADVGTSVVNYRNEPLALRVRNPSTNQQATGDAGDLALAFSSRVDRADDRLDVQPPFYPPLTPRVGPRDPYTPLLQAFENDKVQIRILVGAHEEGHNFGVNGIKWKFEPSEPNSGWRNNQMMGISEHFEFEVPQLVKNPDARAVDYLWTAGSSTDDLWNGIWGVLRVYKRPSLGHFDPASPDSPTAGPTSDANLQTLPSNPSGAKAVSSATLAALDPEGICPATAKARTYSIVATTAAKALPPLPFSICSAAGNCGTLIYNSRAGLLGEGPLHDPTAILYVRATDLDANGKLIAGRPIEPLVIRARAGECLKVTLKNDLPAGSGPLPDKDGFATLPFIVDNFNNNQIRPSRKVGLHPQMVFYDVWKHDGNNVGVNPIQTVDPGGSRTYTWYAGDVFLNTNGSVTLTPIEFGATNLMPADRLKQMAKGAFGALIVEPPGANWTEDVASRASATVSATGVPTFREFVTMFQNFVNMRYRGDVAVPNTAEAEDAEDSGQKAFNYRTEPMWFRMGFAPDTPLETTRTFDFSNVLNNTQVGGDPKTPIFTTGAGVPVRFRILHGGGNQRNNVWSLHGHAWEREPYVSNSTRLGDSSFSMFQGAQFGIGPGSHFDALLRNGAGGLNEVTGDYLYRDFASFQFSGGLWGLMRVVGFSSDPGAVEEPTSSEPSNEGE